MKPSYFSNKKSLQVVSSSIRNDIKSQIQNIGSFNLSSKYYTFLNKKNVNNLKENNFLVTLSTFGKKFVLFMTKYNSKNYCIFINKKNESMTVSQLKFSDDIFNGTLFDGELVKNNYDKWIYLINDIAYYKGDNIITKPFNERQRIIEHIIENEQNNDLDEHLNISKKEYFEHKFLKDLCNNYINSLNYKCAGIYFNNTSNFSDNYLFIFPECRSDSKILNGTMKDGTQIVNFNKIKEEEEELDLFHEVEIVETISDNVSETLSDTLSETLSDITDDLGKKEIETGMNSTKNLKENQNKKTIQINIRRDGRTNDKLEKTTCKFLINQTIMPDIYELYCRNSNNNIEKYSYASVPDMVVSEFIKSLFNNCNYDRNEDINTRIENGKALYVECNYHKSFKKWVPYKRVDSMDTINTINQIQIILDSL